MIPASLFFAVRLKAWARRPAGFLALGIGLALSLHAQTVTPAPQPAEEPRPLQPLAPPSSSAQREGEESILTLSPFTVTAGSEKGYLATQTLNGTRLKSSLRDVGAAMTIFTDQLMDDLAANSVLELARFAPNTDNYVGNISDTAGSGNEFLTSQSPTYVTRGGTTGLVSQDFFSTPSVPPDRYNAENFTFTRGPNAILFGLGNPAGAFVSSTKRANFRNRYSLEIRGDEEGSLRASVDLNQVLIPKRLAVRYAGLYDDAETFRDPSLSTQRRHFFTAQYTPFAKTALRANFEMGNAHTLAVRPWPSYDGITPWIAAGRPFIAVAKAAPVAGTERAYGNANQSLIYTGDTPAGTVVAPVSWALMSRSANPAYPNYPVLGAGLRSLVNPDLFPTDANVTGSGNFRDLHFKSGAVFLEQQITQDLFIEAAYSRVQSDTMVANSISGQFDRIYVDVNQQLPNGSPNPNVGMYYVDSFMNYLPNRYRNNTGRVMVSYDFNPVKFLPKFGAWLGHHRLAAMVEDSNTGNWGSQNPSHNLTPLAGSSTSIPNLQNRVVFRYYLDPARGITSGGFDARDKYPFIFANDALPAPNASGVTPGFVAVAGGTAADTLLLTRMIATQSYFWKDRIVATFGLREDKQITYRGQQADFNPYADARGIFPDPRKFDARRDFPNSRDEREGNTFSRGLVFHALPWLSLSYNKSNNLQPNSTVRDVSGNLLPNQEGEGEDYSLKFLLLDNRIVADVSYYKNYSKNRPDTAVANGVHGNFQNDINAIWTAVAGVTNDPKYLNQPYAFTGSVWQDVNTGYSDGYEASLTMNLTPQWRFTINGAKRGPGATQDRGSLLRAYLATNLPLWKGNAQWMATPLAGSSDTVATAVGRIENTLASFNALAGLPSDSLLSPAWSCNFVTGYDFSKTSRLRGFSVGATANIRGKTIIGFAENASQVLVADQPYYAPEYSIIGARVSYRCKLYAGKVDWRIQLNVRNLLDQNHLFPNRAVDRRDGTHAADIAVWRLNEPRTFVLTSEFSF